MSTKELARKLGLLKRRSSTLQNLYPNFSKEKLRKTEQIFRYLVVLDFESTCWKDKNNSYSPEIIEFPAVILNLMNGEVEDKFQYYVQPSEHPRLSEFCKELTGISQDKVDAGIPISTCIKLFNNWIDKQANERNISFPSKNYFSNNQERCIFVTWSDWDLNVCLNYECKRKRINYLPYLKSWIDLRSTYKQFYGRTPKGLNGALNDLGITFVGREHSGIDDAINTANLAWRMVKDGCIMKATKSLIMNLNEINTKESEEGINKSTVCTNKKPKTVPLSLACVNSATVSKSSRTLSTHAKISESTTTSHVTGASSTIVTNYLTSSPSLVTERTRPAAEIARATSNTNTSASIIFRNDLEQEIQMKDLDNVQSKKELKSTSSNNDLQHLDILKKKLTTTFKTPSPVRGNREIIYNGASVTPPLCQCGRRCKRKKVINPGPNIGRVFFSCSIQSYNNDKNTGCGYFQWVKNKTTAGRQITPLTKKSINDRVIPTTRIEAAVNDRVISTTRTGVAEKDRVIPTTRIGASVKDRVIPTTRIEAAVKNRVIPTTRIGTSVKDRVFPTTRIGAVVKDRVNMKEHYSNLFEK